MWAKNHKHSPCPIPVGPSDVIRAPSGGKRGRNKVRNLGSRVHQLTSSASQRDGCWKRNARAWPPWRFFLPVQTRSHNVFLTGNQKKNIGMHLSECLDRFSYCIGNNWKTGVVRGKTRKTSHVARPLLLPWGAEMSVSTVVIIFVTFFFLLAILYLYRCLFFLFFFTVTRQTVCF